MADPRKDPDERRRELFRRMEWLFVYGPPIGIAFITIFGSLFLATVVPLRGTNFWGRLALAAFAILGIPALAYLVRSWWQKR